MGEKKVSGLVGETASQRNVNKKRPTLKRTADLLNHNRKIDSGSINWVLSTQQTHNRHELVRGSTLQILSRRKENLGAHSMSVPLHLANFGNLYLYFELNIFISCNPGLEVKISSGYYDYLIGLSLNNCRNRSSMLIRPRHRKHLYSQI